MLGVASLLVVVTLALLITRVATIALRATGLSHDVARFQARSAFSGVGFTTSESEDVVRHPVRRRIVLALMLLSSAGVATAVGSLLLSFAGTSGVRQPAGRIALLIGGLLVLWRLSNSRWFDRWLSRRAEWALERWTDLDVRDYVRLLQVCGDYSVAEIGIHDGHWLDDRLIGDVHLSHEGVVVLGIRQEDGRYIGAPVAHTRIRRGDTVIAYGRSAVLDELRQRPAGIVGDRAHQSATAAQQRILDDEADATAPSDEQAARHETTTRRSS